MRLKLNAALVLGCAVASAGPRSALAAAEQNRAVLVVDTGEQVKKVCVRFWEESISGAEMLQRADVDAALRPYAGKGVAVCSLCGTGCRTDDSCLTCDPGGRYWAYSRAPAGTSTFALSPAGASNTRVTNGDVEGWRWSLGSSPAYISVAEVCDGAAPPAAAAATTSTATAPSAGATAPSSTVLGPGPAPKPVAATSTTRASRPGTGAGAAPMTGPRLPGPATSTSTSAFDAKPQPGVATPSSTPPVGGDRTAAPAGAGNARSGADDNSPAGLIAFGAILAGLLTWAARARRGRSRTRSD